MYYFKCIIPTTGRILWQEHHISKLQTSYS